MSVWQIIKPPAPSPDPLLCVNKSNIKFCSNIIVIHLNSGMCFTTLSSQFILPSSTRNRRCRSGLYCWMQFQIAYFHRLFVVFYIRNAISTRNNYFSIFYNCRSNSWNVKRFHCSRNNIIKFRFTYLTKRKWSY
jgi:hypothetical protein